MIWVDFGIIGIIAISAAISLVRGFVREAVSLVGWIFAVWLSITYVEVVAVYLQPYIEMPSLRLAAAFLALFMSVIIITGFVVFVIGIAVEKTEMSGTDRVLGVVFGVARGLAIISVIVALAGMTPLPEDPWWGQSKMLPSFERAAVEIRGALPDEVANAMRFQ